MKNFQKEFHPSIKNASQKAKVNYESLCAKTTNRDVLTLQDPNQEIQQLIPTMQLTEGSPPQLKERLLSNKHAIPINQNQIQLESGLTTIMN